MDIRVVDSNWKPTNDTLVTFSVKNLPYEQECETQPLNNSDGRYSRHHRRVPKAILSFDPHFVGESKENQCTHFKKGYQWLFKFKVSGYYSIMIDDLRLVYKSSDGKTNYNTPGRDVCRNRVWFGNSPQRDQWCIFSLHGQNKQLVEEGYASEHVFARP